MEIPLIIWNAVNVLRKSFGAEIEVLDTEMIRAYPDNFSNVKEGYLGVHISVHLLNKFYRVFLKYSLAEDISVYGQPVADDFILKIIEKDFVRYVRKKKLEKISEYE